MPAFTYLFPCLSDWACMPFFPPSYCLSLLPLFSLASVFLCHLSIHLLAFPPFYFFCYPPLFFSSIFSVCLTECTSLSIRHLLASVRQRNMEEGVHYIGSVRPMYALLCQRRDVKLLALTVTQSQSQRRAYLIKCHVSESESIC